jgi:RNA polymerase sigma-70 factor (ECF subfamily)
MPSEPEHADSGGERFTTTNWSLVLSAGHGRSDASKRALASLCEAYWYPLYGYARRRVADPNEAQDLTQAFFAELLEKDYVHAAAPERGRFRAFLLTAFKHFLSKEWRKNRAQKRGGGRRGLPLDFAAADALYQLEPPGSRTAEQWYDRQWTVNLLDHVLTRLEAESACAGKERQFQQLKGFLVGEHSGTSYQQVAKELETTQAAAKMAAHRLRARYRQILREEIAATVADPGDVEDEIRQLFATLAF